MTTCLLSAMRNEGPDLLEWMAWHRLIGFDRIVVWTNDCTDGSDALLDALAGIGWVTHHRHHPAPGASVQGDVATLALQDPQVAGADWLMWLDADEFLRVNTGAGRLPDLVAALGDADGIAVNWRLFGDSGHDRSPPGLVTECFTRAAPLKTRLNRSVKTFHRVDHRIARLFIHRPVWHEDAAPPVTLLTGGGAVLSQDFIHRPKENGNPQEMVDKGQQDWSLAQVNHYAVKALERVAAKKLRGDGLYADWSNRFDFRYLKRFNRNDEVDTTIFPQLPALKAEIARALSDATVAAAYADCTARFRAMLDGLAQETAFLATDRYGERLGSDKEDGKEKDKEHRMDRTGANRRAKGRI